MLSKMARTIVRTLRACSRLVSMAMPLRSLVLTWVTGVSADRSGRLEAASVDLWRSIRPRAEVVRRPGVESLLERWRAFYAGLLGRVPVSKCMTCLGDDVVLGLRAEDASLECDGILDGALPSWLRLSRRVQGSATSEDALTCATSLLLGSLFLAHPGSTSEARATPFHRQCTADLLALYLVEVLLRRSDGRWSHERCGPGGVQV